MKRNVAPFLSVLLVLLLAACNLTIDLGGTSEPAGVPVAATNEPAGVTVVPTIEPAGDIVATSVVQTFEAMTLAAPPPPLDTPTLPPPPTDTPTLTLTATLTASVTPTMTLSPTTAITTPLAGSIRGAVNYPYGPIPRLMIVAFDQNNSYQWWSWFNGEGMASYLMNSYIPPSHYQVVAYDKLGHAGGCTTIVEVKSNQTVVCDITNWGGSYPANPNPIP